MEAGQPHGRTRLLAAGTTSGKKRTLLTSIPLDRIQPNPEQPRRYFDEETLKELADSIRERGLLQPVIVQRDGESGYRLIAGERRYRASRMAGLAAVPALVRDDDPLEVAMIENLQREDLTPLEAAHAMAGLIRERGYTHADLAGLVHKSRPYVSNTLALLKLPKEIQEEYNASPTVPRDILISVARQSDDEAMRDLWQRARLEQLSVRRFRNTVVPGEAADASVRKTVNVARRLGRQLAALPPSIPDEERRSLARTLRRLRRRIDEFLASD